MGSQHKAFKSPNKLSLLRSLFKPAFGQPMPLGSTSLKEGNFSERVISALLQHCPWGLCFGTPLQLRPLCHKVLQVIVRVNPLQASLCLPADDFNLVKSGNLTRIRCKGRFEQWKLHQIYLEAGQTRARQVQTPDQTRQTRLTRRRRERLRGLILRCCPWTCVIPVPLTRYVGDG